MGRALEIIFDRAESSQGLTRLGSKEMFALRDRRPFSIIEGLFYIP